MNRVKIILMTIGFLIILGTAGASDLNSISFEQLMIQISIGLMLLLIASLMSERGE